MALSARNKAGQRSSNMTDLPRREVTRRELTMEPQIGWVGSALLVVACWKGFGEGRRQASKAMNGSGHAPPLGHAHASCLPCVDGCLRPKASSGTPVPD